MCKRFFLITIICTTLYSEQLELKTISIIYQNRDYIYNVFANITPNYPYTKKIQYDLKKLKIYQMRDVPFSEWEKQEQYIIPELIAKSGVFCRYKKVTPFIQDTFYTHFLVSLLDLPDYRPAKPGVDTTKYEPKGYTISGYPEEKKHTWCDDAVNLLTNNTYFSTTKIFSNEIQKRLSNNNKLTAPMNNLLCITDLPEKLKTSLLKNDSIALWAKARLGDTTALEKIIQEFAHIDYHGNRTDYALGFVSRTLKDLTFTSKDTCIKMLVYLLDKNIYEKNYYNEECQSDREIILTNLARHYPDIALFGPKFDFLFEGINSICFPDIKLQFYKELRDWIKTQFNITLNSTDEQFYILKDCSGKDKYKEGCIVEREEFNKIIKEGR